MNTTGIERTCHGLSLAAIALAVVTLVAAVWGGFHDWTWDLLITSLAIFIGMRAILACERPGAKWHAE